MQNLHTVGIVIPSRDQVYADTAWCITHMVLDMARHGIAGLIINPKTALVQKSREIGVEQALEAGCTHVLFIDSDMVFPMQTCSTLLQANKNIIGVYAPKRRPGGEVIGVKWNGEPFSPSDKGIVKAQTLGTGVMLVKAKVFDSMLRPWFHVDYDGETGRWESEDEFFCRMAREISEFDIFCHCGLSRHIGHIGTHTFKCEAAGDE